MASKRTSVQKREAGSSVTAERTRNVPTFLPATDIYEDNEKLTVLMDMPGADRESVSVNLENQVLTVTANLEIPTEENMVAEYTEYRVGNYERSFSLTEAIDRDKIEASLSNGVLRLVLPKAESAKAKSIPVKS